MPRQEPRERCAIVCACRARRPERPRQAPLMDPVLVPTIRADKGRADAQARPRAGPSAITPRALAFVAVPLLLLAAAAVLEMRMSTLQALVLSRFAREISWARRASSRGRRFARRTPAPTTRGSGTTGSRASSSACRAAGYTIDAQARPSPRMDYLVARGLFPIYREKNAGGALDHRPTGRIPLRSPHARSGSSRASTPSLR